MKKARISCFGHGWCLEVPEEAEIKGLRVNVTHYMGRFEECIEHLDLAMPGMMTRAWHERCLIQRLGLQETGSA